MIIHIIECMYIWCRLSVVQSCLYGLAAMLWSTADFGLLPTHEPVLSHDLENLLLSMTSENAAERPTAIDVLQVRVTPL